MSDHHQVLLHGFPAGLVVLLLGVSLLSGCAWGSAAQPGKAEAGEATEALAVRVMTYNIRTGKGMDQRYDLRRIADVIVAARPTVVAIQEVDRGTNRSGGDDQAALLAEMTGMHATFGKTIDHDGGEYGQVILTHAEPLEVRVIKLPQASGRERRVALVVTLETEGRRWRFIGTHFDHAHPSEDRPLEASAMVEAFGGDALPSVLAGDLNDFPESDTVKSLSRVWRPTADLSAGLLTFPADKPNRQIDHVLVTPAARWQVDAVTVIDEAVASDHRPVVADLQLRGVSAAQ